VEHGFVFENEIDGRGRSGPEDAKLAEDLAFRSSYTRVRPRESKLVFNFFIVAPLAGDV
jgi:hypothetical protein